MLSTGAGSAKPPRGKLLGCQLSARRASRDENVARATQKLLTLRSWDVGSGFSAKWVLGSGKSLREFQLKVGTMVMVWADN